tara:strand:+ start:169 stop:645 length:477 start_codon:yes stop_codon:yes gene_type:complete
VIRCVTRADIALLVKILGEEFWYESNAYIHFGEYDPLSVQRALDQHLTSGLVVGWASFTEEGELNGAILAMKDKCLWKNLSFLREIGWYAPKGTRGQISSFKLYKKMEEFAFKKGFDFVIMARIKGVPSYDKLDAFYEKLNFKSLEETYIKCLNAKLT